MPSRSFLTVPDASTVTFDADLAKSFQATLAGNRSLVIAGGRDGDEIAILLIQDSTGSRVPTWGSNVSWESGQAPNVTTVAGGMNLFTLVKRGSTWQDKGGAPTKLPSRITSAGLGTMLGAGVVALTLIASNGTGSRPGPANVPNAQEWCTGTGCTTGVKVAKMSGSGELAIGGSGALAVGAHNLSVTNALFSVIKTGFTTVRNTASGYTLKAHGGRTTIGSAGVVSKDTVSGSTLRSNVPGAGIGQAACFKSTGQIGYCSDTPTSGTCTCN